MPYRWVEPEVFVEHEGVMVFHCYRHDMADDRLEYWYTTDSDPEDFDVRDLAPRVWDALPPERRITSLLGETFSKTPPPSGSSLHWCLQVCTLAIDLGLLTQDGVVEKT